MCYAKHNHRIERTVLLGTSDGVTDDDFQIPPLCQVPELRGMTGTFLQRLEG